MSAETELREYMAQEIGGIMDHRSTADYALEFLRTARANNAHLQSKLFLHMQLVDIQKYMKALDESLRELPKYLAEAEKHGVKE